MFVSLAHGDEEIDRTIEAAARFFAAMTTSLWDEVAEGARRESPLWAAALRPEEERELEPVFSPLGDERRALGVETIYEGYLLHYGRPGSSRRPRRRTRCCSATTCTRTASCASRSCTTSPRWRISLR